MDDFLSWLATDGLKLLGDIVIPVAAILIPTVIAVRLSRSERANAIKDRETERQQAAQEREAERQQAIQDRRTEIRLQAGTGIIAALAPMSSIQPTQPIQEHLWRLRAAIAVYRACIEKGDHTGDWLAMRHHEGMALWGKALEEVNLWGGPNMMDSAQLLAVLDVPWRWANQTTEIFTGFLSGHVTIDAILDDGGRLLKAFPELASTNVTTTN